LLVTVRVTSLRGADAGAYYVDPERSGLATYYLDAGEPPGVWRGHQPAAFGLEGAVDAEMFLALLDGAGPSGEQLGRLYTDRSVRGYDITFSAPKSVSTLWALGEKHLASESLAAHDVAVGAVLDFVERHATTRATIDGSVQHVDADGSLSLCSGSTRAGCSTRSCTRTPSSPPRCASRTGGGWPCG
jgi:conjugative relaxase-like TrwC/TraI family protein